MPEPQPPPKQACPECIRLRQQARMDAVELEQLKLQVNELAEYIQFLEDHYGVVS